MTQEQKDFEAKYHYKIVKPLGIYFPAIPIKEYVVTSALREWDCEGAETIFAIKALDYNLENKHWFTIKISKENFDKSMADFEVIRDGKEEVKPVILSEELITWMDEDDDYFYAKVTSFTEDRDTDFIKIPKAKITIIPKIDDSDYIFKYTSITDLGTPSFYKINVDLENMDQSFSLINLARQDILNGDVAYGINRRLLFKEKNGN